MFLCSLAILVTFAGIWWLYTWRKRTFSLMKRLGIPGPEPNLLWGNLYIIWKKGLAPTCHDWLQKYGDIVGYFNGIMPGIVLRDANLIEKVFITDFKSFSGRQIMAVASKNLPFNKLRLTRLSGEEWRQLRGILSPAFKKTNVKQSVPMMTTCTRRFFDVVDELTTRQGTSVELFKPFVELAADISLRFCAGINSDVQHGDEMARTLVHYARKNIGQFNGFFLFLFNILPNIPWLHNFVLLVRKVFTRLPSEEFVEKMRPFIEHRRERKSVNHCDVLQLLLNSEDERGRGNDISDVDTQRSAGANSNSYLSMRTETNICLFLTASIDVVAVSLTMTSYLLAKHHPVQVKVREEVRSVSKNKQVLTFDDVSSLTYLNQVILESHRLYPPLPGSVRRVAVKDYCEGGFRIPKGTDVFVPALDIHYDSNLWPEPGNFDPDRFSPENIDSIKPTSYLPFGLGPRMCIATVLAQTEIALIIAMLVSRYNLELPAEELAQDENVYTATALLGLPREGLRIKLTRLPACHPERGTD
ncbi:cytochrome P450 3A25-like [Dermacentor variabilis]|uniref:cytochrome P450 3A25-like n=1 Tax=Dermacentor variabilis TaxID=34621 RepID=UPI003F5B9A32